MFKNLVLLLTMLTACNVQKNTVQELCLNDASSNNVPEVSFSEIYESEKLNERTISIEGYFSYNMEDIALYPNKSDRSKKGIWLIFNDNLLQHDSSLVKMNGKRVLATGTIDFVRKGHLNFYACTLFNITCIKERR